jgi:hypothetical protein
VQREDEAPAVESVGKRYGPHFRIVGRPRSYDAGTVKEQPPLRNAVGDHARVGRQCVEWYRVAELTRPMAATSQLTDVLTSEVRNHQSTFAGITQ